MSENTMQSPHHNVVDDEMRENGIKMIQQGLGQTAQHTRERRDIPEREMWWCGGYGAGHLVTATLRYPISMENSTSHNPLVNHLI